MKNVLIPARVMLVWIAAIWAFLVMSIVTNPSAEITYYASLAVRIASVISLVVGGQVASWHWRKTNQVFTNQETLSFSLIVICGVAIMAYLVEAIISYSFVRQTTDIELLDVLLKPLSQSYSITAVFGLSFWSSAVISTAVACLLFFPMRLRQLQRDSKAQ